MECQYNSNRVRQQVSLTVLKQVKCNTGRVYIRVKCVLVERVQVECMQIECMQIECNIGGCTVFGLTAKLLSTSNPVEHPVSYRSCCLWC